jgi:hypothetical protein
MSDDDRKRRFDRRLLDTRQRLRATPAVRAQLAGLDRPAAAAHLAEPALTELKCDPEWTALMAEAAA